MMNDEQLSDLRNLLIAAGNDVQALHDQGGCWSDDYVLIASAFGTARVALDKMLGVFRDAHSEEEKLESYPAELRELMDGEGLKELAAEFMRMSNENERVLDEREDLLDRIAALEAANRLRA
jgi:hypothetical protein